MGTRTVSADWLGDFKVDVSTGAFSHRVDEPESVGGSGTGPQPTDLLLAAVASCFVLAVAWSARKLEATLTTVSVEVTGTYDGPRFSEIDIRVRTDLREAERDHVLQSAQRVCYVTNTLRRPPSVTVDCLD